MKTRNFQEDFYYLLNKLKQGENFAFQRFSDGEMDVMQNLHLQLAHNIVKVGNWQIRKNYQEVDYKEFNPKIREHQIFRERLIEAFKFCKKNYYKGISCRCWDRKSVV